MRAIVCDSYGPPEVLRPDEIERPVPGADEVLVKIHTTTVTRTDCGMRGGKPWFGRVFYGLRRPKRRVLGYEFAGVVEAAGSEVEEFGVGDRVFGVAPGTYTEYVIRKESGPFAHIPEGLSFEEAAALPDGIKLAGTALRSVGIEGKTVLVYGASGSIGTAGVQLARALEAKRIVAVTAPQHMELARSLGADEVLDYTKEDFARRGEKYDVILDAVGKRTFTNTRQALATPGTYLPTDGLSNFVFALVTRWSRQRSVFVIPRSWTKDDIFFAKRLVEEGKYRAVVDRTYPLEDLIEATRYVESGQKVGNVVIALT